MANIEEEAVGTWLIDFSLDAMVNQRIACLERDYPYSEALYANVADWEKSTGRNWNAYIAEIA